MLSCRQTRFTALLAGLSTLALTALDDFSGMSEERLALDQAVHRANITVDEWGTEAAAVTGPGSAVSAPAQPQFVVRADRPFAFEIVHRPGDPPTAIRLRMAVSSVPPSAIRSQLRRRCAPP